MTLQGCVPCLDERTVCNLKSATSSTFPSAWGNLSRKEEGTSSGSMLLPWKLWQELSWVFHVPLAAAGQQWSWVWEKGNPTMAAVVPKSKDKQKSGLLGARWFGSLLGLWPIGLLCSLGKNEPIEFDWIRLIWEECTGLSSANDRPLLRKWIIVIGQLRFRVFREGFGMLDWWNTDASLFSDLTQYSLENGCTVWEGLNVQM